MIRIHADARLRATKRIKADIIEPDTVQMDIPLFLRVLELVKESVEDDAQLHEMLERILQAQSENDVLTMDQYEAIKGNIDDSEGDDYDD